MIFIKILQPTAVQCARKEQSNTDVDINQLCRIKIWQKFMAFRHLYYFPIQSNLQSLQIGTVVFSSKFEKKEILEKRLHDKSTFRKFRFYENDNPKI